MPRLLAIHILLGLSFATQAQAAVQISPGGPVGSAIGSLDLARDPGSTVLAAWHETGTAREGVKVRALGRRGEPAGPARRIAARGRAVAVASAARGRFAVAWWDFSGRRSALLLRQVRVRDGSLEIGRVRVLRKRMRGLTPITPRLAAVGGRYVLGWTEHTGRPRSYLRPLDASARPVRARRSVPRASVALQLSTVGRHVLVGSSGGVRRYDRLARPVGQARPTSSVAPTLIGGHGGALTLSTRTDAEGRTEIVSGMLDRAGIERAAGRRVGPSDDDAGAPVAAFDGVATQAGWLIGWTLQGGPPDEVRVLALDRTGAPTGAPRILTNRPLQGTNSSSPLLAVALGAAGPIALFSGVTDEAPATAGCTSAACESEVATAAFTALL